MKLSRLEQETIITYNEAEQTASIYSYNKAMHNKLERLEKERPEDCRVERVYPDGVKEYQVPKAWIKVVPPRQLSEAQKAVLERARAKARKAL